MKTAMHDHSHDDLPGIIGVRTFNGRAFTVFVDGSLVPVISGGADDDGGGNDEGGDDDGGDDAGDEKDKSVPQEQVNRIAAKAERKGKQAAETELADKLGVSIDEAADIITKHKEHSDQEKSEAQRAKDAADERTRAAEEREAKAARRERDADVRTALAEAGCQGKKMKRAATSVLADLDDDADQAAIADAVKELADDETAWFTPAADDTNDDKGSGTRRAPSGESKGGGKAPASRGGGRSGLEKGAERARELSKVGAGGSANPFDTGTPSNNGGS